MNWGHQLEITALGGADGGGRKGAGVLLSEPAMDSCVTPRITLLLPGPRFLALYKGSGRGDWESSC